MYQYDDEFIWHNTTKYPVLTARNHVIPGLMVKYEKVTVNTLMEPNQVEHSLTFGIDVYMYDRLKLNFVKQYKQHYFLTKVHLRNSI